MWTIGHLISLFYSTVGYRPLNVCVLLYCVLLAVRYPFSTVLLAIGCWISLFYCTVGYRPLNICVLLYCWLKATGFPCSSVLCAIGHQISLFYCSFVYRPLNILVLLSAIGHRISLFFCTVFANNFLIVLYKPTVLWLTPNSQLYDEVFDPELQDLVNEKIRSQQLSNELEKLNGELERVGINKEKLVMAEHSQDER